MVGKQIKNKMLRASRMRHVRLNKSKNALFMGNPWIILNYGFSHGHAYKMKRRHMRKNINKSPIYPKRWRCLFWACRTCWCIGCFKRNSI